MTEQNKTILGRFYLNKSREKGSVYGVGRMYLSKDLLQFMMVNLETIKDKEVFPLGIIGGLISDEKNLDKNTGLPAKYFLLKVDEKVLNETITKNKSKSGQTSIKGKEEASKTSGKTNGQNKDDVESFF